MTDGSELPRIDAGDEGRADVRPSRVAYEVRGVTVPATVVGTIVLHWPDAEPSFFSHVKLTIEYHPDHGPVVAGVAATREPMIGAFVGQDHAGDQAWLDRAPIHFRDAVRLLEAVQPLDAWARAVLAQGIARRNLDLGSPAARVQWAARSGEDVTPLIEAGLRVAAAPRRRTITDEHLAGVARVYQQARRDGDPPTRAVADAFTTSYSTAARWVGMAREAGKLPPTTSSRSDRGGAR